MEAKSTISVSCVNCDNAANDTEYALCEAGWVGVSKSCDVDDYLNNRYRYCWYCPDCSDVGFDLAIMLPLRVRRCRN